MFRCHLVRATERMKPKFILFVLSEGGGEGVFCTVQFSPVYLSCYFTPALEFIPGMLSVRVFDLSFSKMGRERRRELHWSLRVILHGTYYLSDSATHRFHLAL